MPFGIILKVSKCRFGGSVKTRSKYSSKYIALNLSHYFGDYTSLIDGERKVGRRISCVRVCKKTVQTSLR